MNAPLVLGCGTIDGRKGTDLFIQVAYRVLADFGKDSQKTDQNWNLLILFAGSGVENELHSWCEHDAKILKIADRVHFVGQRDNPVGFYKNAQVFLLTSREDPFPLVSMESIGYGLPVIAFEGATGQGILLERCGIMVPYSDIDAMAKISL